jgi:hypothetical protein
MNASTPLSHRVQLLSEPAVLSSIATLARHIGVPPHEAQEVVYATQRIAGDALRRDEAFPPVALPEGDPASAVLDPPADDLAFLCWLHFIAGREAVRRARPSWVEGSPTTLDDPPPKDTPKAVVDPGESGVPGLDDDRLTTLAVRAFMILRRNENGPVPKPPPKSEPPSTWIEFITGEQRHTLRQVATAAAMVTLAILQHPAWLRL